MTFVGVLIEEQSGQRMTEQIVVPFSVFPLLTDNRFTCLRFVDPYGDTTFNTLQMPFVLADLALLKSERTEDEIKKHIEPIEAMAKVCEGGVGLHLKFLGD